MFTAGQYEASVAASERAAELARTGGDDLTRVRTDVQRLNILQVLSRLADALRVGQELLPLAESVGDLDGVVLTLHNLAYIHALQGALAASWGHMARALAPAEHTGDPGRLAYTLALRGWIAIMGGDWRGAAADLDRARALSRQGNQSWWSGRSWPSFNAWVHAWTRAEPSRL